MEKNFTIVDVSLLRVEEHEFDLHNDFDLVRTLISLKSNQIDLVWSSTELSNFKGTVTLTFTGVNRFLFSSEGLMSDEGSVLSHIGYLPRSEFGQSQEFMTEDHFSDDVIMIVSFENYSFMSIDSDRAIASVHSGREPVRNIRST